MKGNASTSLMKGLIKGTTTTTTTSSNSQQFHSPSGMSSPSSSLNRNLTSPLAIDMYSMEHQPASNHRASPLASNPSLLNQSSRAAVKRQQSGANKHASDEVEPETNDSSISSIGTKFALTMLGLNPNRLNKNLFQKVFMLIYANYIRD